MSASFHFLQSTLANVPISQVQSVSDYAHPSPVSSIHRRDDDSDKKRIEDWSRRQPCVGCVAQAKVDGSFGYATEGDNTKRWMDKDGVRINGTAWACNKCKVNLCEACFGDFDHARGCLMGQKVAV